MEIRQHRMYLSFRDEPIMLGKTRPEEFSDVESVPGEEVYVDSLGYPTVSEMAYVMGVTFNEVICFLFLSAIDEREAAKDR